MAETGLRLSVADRLKQKGKRGANPTQPKENHHRGSLPHTTPTPVLKKEQNYNTAGGGTLRQIGWTAKTVKTGGLY